MKKLIHIICPVYNNNQSLTELVTRSFSIQKELDKYDIRMVLIDDGSTDSSWKEMIRLQNQFKKIKLIKLTKNYGQINAIIAGLHSISVESYFVILSSDLQDPPEKIKDLVRELEKGYEIVFAERQKRNDGYFINLTSNIAWKILKFISKDLPYRGSDFFILSNKVKEMISNTNEKEIFIQNKIINTGYSFSSILYERLHRKYGKSSSNFEKRFRYFINGLYDCSGYFLKKITQFSFLTFVLSLFGSIIYFILYFINEENVSGWTTIIVALFGLFSLNFLFISVLGEYIWKIYQNINDEKTYIIKEEIDFITK